MPLVYEVDDGNGHAFLITRTIEGALDFIREELEAMEWDESDAGEQQTFTIKALVMPEEQIVALPDYEDIR